MSSTTTRGGGVPPWHLWGSSQFVDLFTDPPLNVGAAKATHQLAKVGYGRPDTWHWIFFLNVLEADAADPGQDLFLDVRWDLTIGLGRTSSRCNDFDRWYINWTGPAAGPVGATYWAQRAIRAPLPRLAVAADPDEVIERIVAESIQLEASVQLSESGVLSPKRARVEVGAFFAPSTHVRPDWYQIDGHPTEQFPGDEVGGR